MIGTTLLRGIVGSTAYGLEREGSDVDRLGMHVFPTERFFGICPPTRKELTHVEEEPSDYTSQEASKYLQLALKANPTVTELLWLPAHLYEVVTPEGVWLMELRDRLACAQDVRNAYMGYATEQFRRLSERGDGSLSSDTRNRTEKHARHLKRLTWQGFQFYSTGILPIRVERPQEYFEFGEQVVKNPNIALAWITQYGELFDRTKSVLPSEPDQEGAEKWLLQVRRRFLTL